MIFFNLFHKQKYTFTVRLQDQCYLKSQNKKCLVSELARHRKGKVTMTPTIKGKKIGIEHFLYQRDIVLFTQNSSSYGGCLWLWTKTYETVGQSIKQRRTFSCTKKEYHLQQLRI